MLTRILAATAAGAIVFFCLGFVVYSFIVDPILKDHMNHFPGLMKEPMPNIVLLLAWNLVMSFLFALIFEKWAGVRTFTGGLKTGALLMLIVAVMTDLNFLAFMNLFKDAVGVLIEIAAATFVGAIACGVIGWVLGLMNKRTAG